MAAGGAPWGWPEREAVTVTSMGYSCAPPGAPLPSTRPAHGPARESGVRDGALPILSPRPLLAASARALSERVAPRAKRVQRGQTGSDIPATARTANDKTRYSQTLQPGSDEYYAFYLNRRKGERKAQHAHRESTGNGWTHAEENNVVKPWLHEKELRRKNAQGIQQRQKDADKRLLEVLQGKARARDREEAKGLMMDLHRWIARMTARIENRATSNYLSDISKTMLRRDQLQLRSNIARLLQFTNVLSNGNRPVSHSLLEQLRKFHNEVQQADKVAATSHRGRREGLPPRAQLQDLATGTGPSSTYGKADAARWSGVASDSEALLGWRPVYETDGISVGIRTYRSLKGKIVEDNTGSEVELLLKVRRHYSAPLSRNPCQHSFSQ